MTQRLITTVSYHEIVTTLLFTDHKSSSLVVYWGADVTRNTLFSEKQRFPQWWLWLAILVIPITLFWSLFAPILINNSVGDDPVGDSTLIILGLLIGVGFPWLCYWTVLDTKIHGHGVCIRFRPFHRRWVVFRFEDIHLVEAVTYNPLRDFGGWGIKYGKGVRAYNVSGNKGVSLTLKNGEKILIGPTDQEVLCSRIQANHQRIGA